MPDDREIWFHRWLTYYTPCHWKGGALLVGGFLATFAAASVLEPIVPPLIVFLIGGGIIFWVASRHSR